MILAIAGIFLVSFLLFSFALLSGSRNSERVAAWILGIGWVVNGFAIVNGWAEARWLRPPWLGFSEALVFLAWAVTCVQLYAQLRWGVRWMGALSSLLGFCLLLGAFLVEAPLAAPSLSREHFFVYLHPPLGVFAYGFFAVAAALGLLDLFQKELRGDTLLAGGALVCAVLLPGIAGGEFFTNFQFALDLMNRDLDGALRTVPGQLAIVPYANWAVQMALGAMAFHALAGTLVEWKVRPLERQVDARFLGYPGEKIDLPRLFLRAVFGVGVISLWVVLGACVWANWFVPGARWLANPYRMTGLCLITALATFVFGAVLRRDNLRELLPPGPKLDRWTYQCVVSGFVLLTLALLTGALWAYLAWGRPWGWDLKEVWVLGTWVLYAIYLHVRPLVARTSAIPAVVALLGLAAVLFTFVGPDLIRTTLHVFTAVRNGR